MNPSKICPKPMHWWCWATSREPGSHLGACVLRTIYRQPAAPRNGRSRQATRLLCACACSHRIPARAFRGSRTGGRGPGKLRLCPCSSFSRPSRPRGLGSGSLSRPPASRQARPSHLLGPVGSSGAPRRGHAEKGHATSPRTSARGRACSCLRFLLA